jgi:hypothetical protein
MQLDTCIASQLKLSATVSAPLGIEAYVAKIVYDEAKKIVAESSLVAP